MSRKSSVLPLLVALGCSASTNSPSLVVGTEGTGGVTSGRGLGAGGDPNLKLYDAGPPRAFSAHVVQNHIAVTFVTLGCTGDCADVEAVATGGALPYTYTWENGSTNPSRRVCPTSTTAYQVSVTDAGFTSVEFRRPPTTVTAPLTANVIPCLGDGGNGLGHDASSPLPPAAPPVYWATWAVPSPGTPGSAKGVTSPPGGDVGVTFTGEVGAGSAATGAPTLSGVGQVYFRPASTYQSPTVPNAPPDTGMVTIWSSSTLTQTITFSVPVRDPLIAVVALYETWNFDATPMLLSTGPNELAYPLGAPPFALNVAGGSLTATSGNGVVEFPGTFTSIQFTVPVAAVGDFTGFTIGIRGRS